MALQNIIHKRQDSEEGFTLIELVVVVAIIGILAAVGLRIAPDIVHTANGNAMKANSEALWKEAQIEMTDEDVSMTYQDYDRAQAILDQVFFRHYEKMEKEGWILSMQGSRNETTGGVGFCINTSDKDNFATDKPFTRSYGNLDICEDEG